MSEWSHSCGTPFRHPDDDQNELSHPEKVSKVVGPLFTKTEGALSRFRSFSKEYVWTEFRLSVEMHHSQWSRMPWEYTKDNLPGKEYGLPINDTILRDMESRLEPQLKTVYEVLQPYVAYLWATSKDHGRLNDEEKRSRWSSQFRQLAEEVQVVLCELRSALWELGHISVDGEPLLMVVDPDSLKSPRNLMDWLSLRDTTNALEFLHQICEVLLTAANAAIPK